MLPISESLRVAGGLSWVGSGATENGKPNLVKPDWVKIDSCRSQIDATAQVRPSVSKIHQFYKLYLRRVDPLHLWVSLAWGMRRVALNVHRLFLNIEKWQEGQKGIGTVRRRFAALVSSSVDLVIKVMKCVRWFFIVSNSESHGIVVKQFTEAIAFLRFSLSIVKVLRYTEKLTHLYRAQIDIPSKISYVKLKQKYLVLKLIKHVATFALTFFIVIGILCSVGMPPAFLISLGIVCALLRYSSYFLQWVVWLEKDYRKKHQGKASLIHRTSSLIAC